MGSLKAITLEELETAEQLTPISFAERFAGFEFKFHDAIQAPAVFLSSRSGDCDDFSTLAARILEKRGYTPRLVTVRMPKVAHVVCYIEETGAYLDYNFRESGSLVKSGPGLVEIARSVAKSYGTKWVSVSEFTYDGLSKRLVQTVIEKDRQMASLVH
jgi:hypothetical protein